jgi:hypothetical protein
MRDTTMTDDVTVTAAELGTTTEIGSFNCWNCRCFSETNPCENCGSDI